MILEQFNNTIQAYINLWHKTAHIHIGEKQSLLKRTLRFMRIKKQLNRVCKKLCENSPLNMEQMRDDTDIVRLMDLWLQFDVSKMSESLKGDYVIASEVFIKRVKERWPNMPPEDIFQALRNVWIMIAIQIMSEMPVMLTDAMFAYSMLYPLTDNLLDDASRTYEEKSLFNTQLSKRLNGLDVTAYDTQERDVFDMIALIEQQYPRADYPDVYDSMLLIHDAQIRSLNQQYEQLSDSKILKLSFEKGAASVIADGYLVLGHLNAQQFSFLTGYGIVLQLADDLQDIEDDRENAHFTLFSSENNKEQLGVLTQKLINLSKETLVYLPCSDTLFKSQLTTLLDKSLSYLISDAIFSHKDKMPRHFIRTVNACHLTGLNHYKRLKKITMKWVDLIKKLNNVQVQKKMP